MLIYFRLICFPDLVAVDTPLASDPDMILGLIWASPGKEITDLGGRGRHLYFSIESTLRL